MKRSRINILTPKKRVAFIETNMNICARNKCETFANAIKNILMKNINLILGIFVLSGLASCQKFLDKAPISSYNVNSAYQSQSDFQLAITGTYRNLGSISFNRTIFTESRTDNVKARQIGSENQTFAILSTFTETPATGSIINLWSSYWAVISQTNIIIERINAASFDDENMRNAIKGEAYFLRGFAYFELAWMWGGMPLVDHQVTPAELAQIKRSSQSETLEFAKGDFLKAIDLLPEAWPSKYLGRATKYAAEGYLARLYMFNGEFEKSIPALTDIIQSNRYQMAALYPDIFSEANDNSKEHVFQVQFNAGAGALSFTLPQYLIGPYVNQYFPNGSSPGIFISDDLYDAFDNNDERRDFSLIRGMYSTSGIYNTTTIYNIKFAHGITPANISSYGLNMPLLRYTDILLMYAESLNEARSNAATDIFDIVNTVRARAGLDPINGSGLTKEEIRDIISSERRLEFNFEGIRWFDLIRTNKALSTMTAFLARTDEGSAQYKMNQHQILFPIPQDEININPDPNYMWQNPGF